MLTLNESTVSSLTPKFAAIKPTAGENILDASGETKVIKLTRPSKAHFLPDGKFCGLAGSSCPSQPTMPRTRSVSGKSWLRVTGGEEDASLEAKWFSRSAIRNFWNVYSAWKMR